MRFKEFISETITAQNIETSSSIKVLRKQFPNVDNTTLATGVINLMNSDPSLRTYVSRTPDPFNLQILNGAIANRVSADPAKIDQLKQLLPIAKSVVTQTPYEQLLQMRKGTGLEGTPIKPIFQKAETLPPPVSKEEYEKWKGVDNPPVEVRNKFYDNGFLWKEVGGYGLKRIFRWMPPMKFKFSS